MACTAGFVCWFELVFCWFVILLWVCCFAIGSSFVGFGEAFALRLVVSLFGCTVALLWFCWIDCAWFDLDV